LFRDNETNEIRIYGLESKDIFKVTGPSKRGVKVRIVDPEEQDSMLLTTGHFNKVSKGDRFEFDTFHQKKFDFSILPLMSPKDYKVFDTDPLELFTRTGLRVSVNFRYNTKPWKKTEYENEHLVSFNYGFTRGALNAGYIGRLRQYVGPMDLLLKARLDFPAVENFYGLGNNTINENISPTYYSTISNRFYGSVGLAKDFGDRHHFEAGLLYQRIKVAENNVIKDFHLNQTVFTPQSFGGFEAGYRYINTNSDVFPTKGARFIIGGGYLQNLKNTSRSFFRASSSLAAYLPLGNSFSIGVRAGGGSIFGEADYYHMMILGGNENLRGYTRERFFGKTSFYNNNEIRFVRPTSNFFFSGKIGLLAFLDNGRVWMPGETSNQWHLGYGGGLIIIPFNKAALTATYGLSKDGSHFLLQSQLFF
jgi:hypothetical protein